MANPNVNEVFSEFVGLMKSAKVLLWKTKLEEFGDLSEVEYDKGNPDEAQKFQALSDMLNRLNDMTAETEYLTRAVVHESVLHRQGNGRYADEYQEYTSGSGIEVLLDDGYAAPHWEACRVEHDGEDYYLVGHKRIPMEGLHTRIRTK